MIILDKLQVCAPKIINEGRHQDVRGKLIYFNTLDLEAKKIFYSIHAVDIETVRAWQGHKIESKWFYVTSGSFKIVIVEIDNWENPSQQLIFQEFVLNIKEDKVLFVPSGFASGFRALDENSKLMVFSDCTLEDSLIDDFRFDKNLWYKW